MEKSPIPQHHHRRSYQFHPNGNTPSPFPQFPSRNHLSTPSQPPEKPSFLRQFSRKIFIIFSSFSSKSDGVGTSEGGDATPRDHGYVGSIPDVVERSSCVSVGLSAGSKSSGGSSYGKHQDSFGSSGSANGHVGSMNFSLQDILEATNNFSRENLIGQGGFGTVYKGRLKDGSFIAVKRAKSTLFGKRLGAEFRNEILALSKIEHLNLVRLYGYVEGREEKVIVVEYVGNGNLQEHLDGTRGNGLELAQRLDIAIDVAHAVAYLHNYSDPPIIHRDIKASNIVITEKLRAKVADFGFARMVPEEDDPTHVSTQVKGTAGYLDPEYVRTYQLTDKSDVYSFGVLLVELITGRRPLEPKRGLKERITTKWAMQALKQDAPVLAMDPKLQRSPASISAVERMLKLARKFLASTRPSRPSMRECAEELWGIRKDFRDQAKLTYSTSQRTADLYGRDHIRNR